jgi:hypothetical protein
MVITRDPIRSPELGIDSTQARRPLEFSVLAMAHYRSAKSAKIRLGSTMIAVIQRI